MSLIGGLSVDDENKQKVEEKDIHPPNRRLANCVPKKINLTEHKCFFSPLFFRVEWLKKVIRRFHLGDDDKSQQNSIGDQTDTINQMTRKYSNTRKRDK